MKRPVVAILGMQTRNGPDAAGATRQMRPPGGPDAAGAKRTRQSPLAAGAPPHRKALERNRAAVPLETLRAGRAVSSDGGAGRTARCALVHKGSERPESTAPPAVPQSWRTRPSMP